MADLPLAWRGGTRGSDAGMEAGPVRGREPELRAVVELVRGAAKGRGDTLLIEGGLGAGKSLLLRYAASAARAEGVSVAAASADELSRFMPLGPVLRKLGVRRRHWAVEIRPTTGWLSLTGTECAVSELVAEGLTNQQVAEQMFISVHTVAFRLRQVFRKLGISSRVELARGAAAARAAIAGPHSLMPG